MNIWLLKDGEPLPIQPDARRMRTWMLAEELVRRGHDVTWWSSTHSHQHKQLLFDRDHVIDVKPGFQLRLLAAGAYASNRSPRRLLHHARLAAKFRGQAGSLPPPDAVVSSLPTIELAYESVAFGRRTGVPVVVDVRDPWPDVLIDHAPRPLRALAGILLQPLDAKARAAIAGSRSLVACSPGFLDWALRKAGIARRPGDRVFHLGKSASTPAGARISPRMAALADSLKDKVVFCFLGSFGHVYELDLVCEAAARMSGDSVHFVFAGDGAQSGRVGNAARRLDNVTATGWLDGADAAQLLAIAHVGLAPYGCIGGAMPNKMADYSAAGLPILSSLQGEMAQMLADYGAGLSYAPGDVGNFVAQVRALAADSGRRTVMAGASARMFECEFQAEKIYADYVSHVESLARPAAA
jgi:glycosyltransferase involved in cell wall biosynthesis